MSVTKEEVLYIAALAKLDVDEAAAEALAPEMARMIDMAGQLSALDTSAAGEYLPALGLQNIFRSDEVSPSYDRETLLQNAPARQDGCWLVPRVVE